MGTNPPLQAAPGGIEMTEQGAPWLPPEPGAPDPSRQRRQLAAAAAALLALFGASMLLGGWLGLLAAG